MTAVGDGSAHWSRRRRMLILGHGIVALLCLLLLWSFSYPGFDLLTAFFAVPLLGIAVFVWLGWLVNLWRPWRRGHRQRWSWVFTIAPLLGALTLGLVSAGVPFGLRWWLARGDFVAVVRTLPDPTRGPQPADDTESPLRCERFPNSPSSMGSDSIASTCRIPFGYIFEESHGTLFGSAGFAYLPKGSPPDYLDDFFPPPQRHHLDGPWYSWIATD